MSGSGHHEATYKGFSTVTPPSRADESPVDPQRRDTRPGHFRLRRALVPLVGALAIGILGGLGVSFMRDHLADPPLGQSETRVSNTTVAVVRTPARPVQAPARTDAPDLFETARPPARVETPVSPARRAVVAVSTSGPAAPAFHCDWSLRRSERMICSDPALANLDRQLNHEYGEAVRAGAPKAQLRAAQDAWVFRREAAARSHAELADYYRRRILELRAIRDQAG
jgi:uncharacterized protein YecT (DUF1311 family)